VFAPDKLEEFKQGEIKTIEGINFGKYSNVKGQTINLVCTLNKLLRSDYSEQRTALATEFAGALSSSLNQRITSHVLLPASSGLLNNLSGKITESLLANAKEEAKALGVAAGSGKKSLLEELKDTWESVSYEELRKQKRELKQKWLQEAQEEEAKQSGSALLLQTGAVGSHTQAALVSYRPTLDQNTMDSTSLATGSISFAQTQFAALIRQKLVEGDKAIIKIQNTIESAASWTVNKFPRVYLSYQMANVYAFHNSYTAPERKLLSFMNRQADKYIVNPLLQQIGINQGDPGYVTGKIIIDTALATAITKGVQAKIASPYTVIPAKPTAITYKEGFAAQYKRFTIETNWTSPVGTKQTYKVFQRNDIDWNMVRSNSRGPRKFIGKTNRDAALAGYRPELVDGNFVATHHIGQSSKGPIVEASTKQHSFKNQQAFKALHNQFGGKKHPNDPVDHKIWDKEQVEYWKWRAKNEK